jgi:hypothetical protein
MATPPIQAVLTVDTGNVNSFTYNESLVVPGTGTNRLMLACLTIRASGVGTITSVTWNGSEALTFLGGVSNGTAIRTEFWYRWNPTATTANLTIVTDENNKKLGPVYILSGVKTDPNEFESSVNLATGSSASSVSGLSVPGTVANDLIIDTIALQAGTDRDTVPTSPQTERFDQFVGDAGAGANVGSSTMVADATDALGWSWGATHNYIHASIPIRQAVTKSFMATTINATTLFVGVPRIRKRIATTISAITSFTGATRMRRRMVGAFSGVSVFLGTPLLRRRMVSAIGATVAVAGIIAPLRMQTTVAITAALSGATRLLTRSASAIEATVDITATPLRRLTAASSIATGAFTVDGVLLLRRQMVTAIAATTEVSGVGRVIRRMSSAISSALTITGSSDAGLKIMQSVIEASVELAASPIVRKPMASILTLSTTLTSALYALLRMTGAISASAEVVATPRRRVFMAAPMSASLIVEGGGIHYRDNLRMASAIMAVTEVTGTPVRRAFFSTLIPIAIAVDTEISVGRVPVPIYLGRAKRATQRGGDRVRFGGKAKRVQE